MLVPAQIRKILRPHGVVAATCQRCTFHGVCGGIESELALLNCVELCKWHKKRCDRQACNSVCPLKKDFPLRVSEVRGLCFDNLRPIEQKPLRLPHYIPLIDHGYSRSQPLKWPIVAITTYELFRLRNNNTEYRALAQTPQQVREIFCLAPETDILLVGVANDRTLEKYWAYRRTDRVPFQLGKLGILGAIGPNFSHFLDVPRTDNLFNRKRQLICLEELYQADICPIPHLSAAAPGDWRFWHEYLQNNPKINTVAVEFQTGNKSPTEGKKVLDNIADIQIRIGRYLHLLIVGGGQFVTDAAEIFEQITLIDSSPFMKAMKRHSFVEGVTRRIWEEGYSLERQPLDDLLYRNIEGYTSWAESAIRGVHSQHNWPRPR